MNTSLRKVSKEHGTLKYRIRIKYALAKSPRRYKVALNVFFCIKDIDINLH